MNDWDPLREQPMGEILLWKPHGLTHDDTIKAHHLFTATTKKTPYQLDLEVKDRKPDIVPKVGDKVKIKSREWYEKWRNDYGNVTLKPLNYWGNGDWVKHLGQIYSVKSIYKNCFFLDDCPAYAWAMNMFEEVYPQESSKAEKYSKAFESLAISVNELDKAVKATSAIPAINPIQGIGIATDWSKLVSDTAARITIPQQNLFCSPGFYCQSVLKDEEPELQTIKKHRFIKLEKL